MNLWVETPTPQLLNTIHFYGWKKGLKTGMYYLRSKALTGAQKFVLDPKTVEKAKQSVSESKDSDVNNSGGGGGLSVEDLAASSAEKKGRLDQQDGKTYTCTDDVCVSCGS
jgi:ribonucleotide reductase alpha subunit